MFTFPICHYGAGIVPNIIPTLELWLDATDSSTVDRDGSNNVDRWDDKSGNGNNLLQGTGTAQPLYDTSGLNGRATIIFDGVNDSLARNITDYDATNGITLFAVYKSAVVTQSNLASVFANSVGNVSGTFEVAFSTDVSNRLAVAANYDDNTLFNVAIEAAPGNTSPTIASVYLGGATNTITFQNGINISNIPLASPFSCTFNGYRTGANRANNVFFNGNISEVILYISRLSTSDRIGVERYLGDKYGISMGG